VLKRSLNSRFYQEQGATKKKQVTKMFDGIAPYYDLLNRLLSLGIDTIWRTKAIKKLKANNPQAILDIATGTADLAIEAAEVIKPKSIIGMDIAKEMLRVGDKKIAKKGLLEFSRPKAFPLKQGFNIYFKHILPVIGKLKSKDPKAYKYLYESVQAFPDYEQFASILKGVGFTEVTWKPLSFGICTIYLAKK